MKKIREVKAWAIYTDGKMNLEWNHNMPGERLTVFRSRKLALEVGEDVRPVTIRPTPKRGRTK